jgi:hypothetical protein
MRADDSAHPAGRVEMDMPRPPGSLQAFVPENYKCGDFDHAMNALSPWLMIAVIAIVLTWLVQRQRRRALQRFWDRHCMGIRWRRRFPDAPQTELREFLTILVDAFGFDHQRRTCFSPEGRVMEVYRADDPPGSLVDDMELERLGLDLEERYGIDLATVWREDLTLGELYEHTRRHPA